MAQNYSTFIQDSEFEIPRSACIESLLEAIALMNNRVYDYNLPTPSSQPSFDGIIQRIAPASPTDELLLPQMRAR